MQGPRRPPPGNSEGPPPPPRASTRGVRLPSAAGTPARPTPPPRYPGQSLQAVRRVGGRADGRAGWWAGRQAGGQAGGQAVRWRAESPLKIPIPKPPIIPKAILPMRLPSPGMASMTFSPIPKRTDTPMAVSAEPGSVGSGRRLASQAAGRQAGGQAGRRAGRQAGKVASGSRKLQGLLSASGATSNPSVHRRWGAAGARQACTEAMLYRYSLLVQGSTSPAARCGPQAARSRDASTSAESRQAGRTMAAGGSGHLHAAGGARGMRRLLVRCRQAARLSMSHGTEGSCMGALVRSRQPHGAIMCCLAMACRWPPTARGAALPWYTCMPAGWTPLRQLPLRRPSRPCTFAAPPLTRRSAQAVRELDLSQAGVS